MSHQKVVLGTSNLKVRKAYGSGSDLSLKSSRTIRVLVLRQIRDLTGFSVAVLIWFGFWSVPVNVLLLCSLVFVTNTGANSLIAQENYARGLSKHLSELCVRIENSRECFQAIERHQIERGINGVARKDSKLIISIRSGTSTVLVDSKENETEGQWFNYVEYLSAINFHLIHVQYYEGDAFLLVNSKSGTKTPIQAPPVISLDSSRFITASPGDPYNPNEIQIWLITKGEPRLEWKFEPANWRPNGPRWVNSSTVVIRTDRLDDPAFTGKAMVQLGVQGWTIKDSPP